ncbi:DUF368 domain-containing protein [Alkalicoccobacillus murimartini]|uniref:Membrane protein n=1 Tax=Alkalicoccobacillus murimartini TaxID=171685 RepID=A0ABT9YK84_9BACI|nr:DUF368 domain-containing protein [Alkalicoccobacillus murimartini]MDQ0208280.1 putative membrane protein [Alkalicoccobacillus murimartini]
MFEYKNIFRGIAMGITDLVPGISGSTILMVLGVYERFIASLNGLTTKEWKKSLGFLIPLGIGVGSALLIFSKVIEWLLEHHQPVTMFLFLGLIIGIVPILIKEVDVKNSFKPIHYVLLVIAFILISLTSLIPNETGLMTNLSVGDYILLFVSGWLASAALILPGISGSLIFLLLGVYATVTSAIANIQISVILVVGSGIAIGLILTSKLVRYLFANYTIYTYAVMIGLVAGSIIVVYSNVEPGGSLIGCGITFIAGLLVAYLLGSIKK